MSAFQRGLHPLNSVADGFCGKMVARMRHLRHIEFTGGTFRNGTVKTTDFNLFGCTEYGFKFIRISDIHRDIRAPHKLGELIPFTENDP